MLNGLPLPKFYWLERTSPTLPALSSASAATVAALDSLALDAPLRGKQIAVAVGSRGISGIGEIARAACAWLKQQGALPFIFPSMGSHGGAVAEGQCAVLAEYGITAEQTGIEIRASMETVLAARTPEGFPVYADRIAWSADGVLVINRVKPHTRFSGKIESGLLKMIAVGMGKIDGAREVHRLGTQYGFEKVIRAVAGSALASGKIMAGLGIVENAHHEPAMIRAALPGGIVAMEEELLAAAKTQAPKLPFKDIDLLVVDEIGKNISGSGMDTKVIGRGVEVAAAEAPAIRLLYARNVTAESEGNALGVGMADLIHERLYRQVDFNKMYVNARTSLNADMARLPMRFSADREALSFALESLGSPDAATLRMALIRNTLSLDRILASGALAKTFSSQADAPDWRLASGGGIDLPWDKEGNLPPHIDAAQD